jgi:hypothetical protein
VESSRVLCYASGAHDQIIIIVRLLRVSWYGEHSLTRWPVCRLQLLPVSSASHSWLRVPWYSRPYFTVSNSRLPFFFFSSPRTRSVTVEVFDPASTLSESWTEPTSCGPNIEHAVGQLIPLLFFCYETCDSPHTTCWFLQAYSLTRKYDSSSRCLATDVSAELFWLHTSGLQASYHNIYNSTQCYIP